MSTQYRVIALTLFFCLLLGTAGYAYDVIDADYSAALITVMGEGRQPQEELIPEMTEQQVQEVAINKQSYTTDVLTVRELPGTEDTELAKLAQ